jgi:hypothetical protein
MRWRRMMVVWTSSKELMVMMMVMFHLIVLFIIRIRLVMLSLFNSG